jgi:CheY-like chemotaxis protein
LKYDLQVDLSEIEGDPAQMQQLLMNLIVNSNEAIGAEAGTITVRTSMKEITAVELADWNAIYQALPTGSYVCLEVADDGHGMEQETLSRIFEPFFTTKFTGRGLGLAAVSGIILGHKGGLKVTSEQNDGTHFQIIFAEVAAKQATAVSEPEPTTNAEFILVIDDELPVREAVSDILALEGLATLTAVDGQSGIDLYKERWSEISLVLLDLSLPDIRGKEVLAQLKAFNPQVQVILSSGYSEGEALQGLENSGIDFLQKPYNISTFLKLVNERL